MDWEDWEDWEDWDRFAFKVLIFFSGLGVRGVGKGWIVIASSFKVLIFFPPDLGEVNRGITRGGLGSSRFIAGFVFGSVFFFFSLGWLMFLMGMFAGGEWILWGRRGKFLGQRCGREF